MACAGARGSGGADAPPIEESDSFMTRWIWQPWGAHIHRGHGSMRVFFIHFVFSSSLHFLVQVKKQDSLCTKSLWPSPCTSTVCPHWMRETDMLSRLRLRAWHVLEETLPGCSFHCPSPPSIRLLPAMASVNFSANLNTSAFWRLRHRVWLREL